MRDRDSVNELGFKERRSGTVTILDTDELLRIKLRFGGSSVTLANAATSLLADGQKHILLNLEQVKSISARGLGELVSTLVVVKDHGGEMKLFNLSRAVRQLMQATNLFSVFGLYDSEIHAVNSFLAGTTPTLKNQIGRISAAGKVTNDRM